MFRDGVIWRFLLALLVIGGLVAGGVALYRYGWAQGYQAAALAAAAEGEGGAPLAPFAYGYPGRFYGPGFGFPFFFGPFIGIGFFLLIFFLFGGLFRFWGWRRWAGTGWNQGPIPPSVQEWHQRMHEQGQGRAEGSETPPENR